MAPLPGSTPGLVRGETPRPLGWHSWGSGGLWGLKQEPHFPTPLAQPVAPGRVIRVTLTGDPGGPCVHLCPPAPGSAQSRGHWGVPAEPRQQDEGPRASSGAPGPNTAPGVPGAAAAPALWPRRQLAPALFTPTPEPGPCAQSWDSCGDSRDTWHWHQATVRGSTSTTNAGSSSVGHSSVGHSSHHLAQGPPGCHLPSYCTQPHRDGGTVTSDASSAHSSLFLAPGDGAPLHPPSPSAEVTVPHNPAPNMWLPGASPGGHHGTRQG